MGSSDSPEDLRLATDIARVNADENSESNAAGPGNRNERAVVGTMPLRRGRRSAPTGEVEKRYRQIAQNGELSRDRENWGAAIQSRIREGVYKKKRISRATRIEVFVPPSFLSVPAAIDESGNQALSQPDDQSKPLHAILHPSQDSVANIFSESTVSLFKTKDNLLMPQFFPTRGPRSILGAGRVDPFAYYPITMSREEEYLIDQMNTFQDPALQTLKDCWFPVAIRHPASFHQFLANLSLNISRAHGVTTNNMASVVHHSHAIRLVNRSLEDSKLGIKDDVVAAVITFISYSILTGDFRSWKLHTEGLEKIFKLRGGHKSLEDDIMLSRLVFWYDTLRPIYSALFAAQELHLNHCTEAKVAYSVDVSGASRQDLKPRFPYPSKLLQEVDGTGNNDVKFSNLPTAYLLPWMQLYGGSHMMMTVFQDLRRAMEYAKFRAAQNHIWRQIAFVIHWIDPVIHTLLDMDPNFDHYDRSSIVQEACRLGLILFLGEVRRKCGVMCVSTKVYVTKLKTLLSETNEHVEWALCKPLRLFVLFFGMLESWKQPEADWYAEAVSIEARGSKITSWEDIVAAAKSFLWFDDIFDSEIENFRNDVMFRVQEHK